MFGKIGVVVQARMSSSRLPGKSLRILGEHPLIYFVLKRLTLLNLPVIVCTSSEASDDILCDYLIEENIPFFRGSLENVLDRYIKTAEVFGLEQLIRVTGDNPFVDIAYLQDSLKLFGEYTYVDGIYEGGLIKGTGFELVSTSELKGIPSQEKAHLEHVTLWLRENLERSARRIQLEPNKENEYLEDIFLTCDYPEDLQLIKSILEHFRYDYSVAIPEILQFLELNPSLKEINRFRHQMR